MDAQRIVQNCVLKNQSTVIEEMIRANLISEEYLYPFVDDVMELLVPLITAMLILFNILLVKEVLAFADLQKFSNDCMLG